MPLLQFTTKERAYSGMICWYHESANMEIEKRMQRWRPLWYLRFPSFSARSDVHTGIYELQQKTFFSVATSWNDRPGTTLPRVNQNKKL
jgi:hypothetical protein